MLEQYVHKDLMFLNLDVPDRPALFKQLAEKLEIAGYVTSGFLDFLNHREDNYPTGLKLDYGAVAIPHGDPQYIVKPFIAVATLIHPVTMHQMEDADLTVPVDVFFILGLNSGESHIKMLQAVIQLIQQEKFVTQIKAAQTPEAAVAAITQGVSADEQK
ncbi:PTS sugar transporter subunit IIA [Lacticaseibacillus rhamnosus]